MIPDFKTYLEESIWSNINKRSEGNLERNEDNIDNLTMREFCDYLNSNYTYVGPDSIMKIGYMNSNQSILFAVNMYHNIPEFISLYCDKNEYYIMPDTTLFQNHQDLFSKLNKKYKITKISNRFKQSLFKIEPNNGVGNYKFFIQVIDDILTFFDKPLFKKNVNESIWSNINKRSEGDVSRKEDDINSFNIAELCEYIKDNYEFSTYDNCPVFIFTNVNNSEVTLSVMVLYDNQRTFPNVSIYITLDPIDIRFSPANMPGRDVIKYFRDKKLSNVLQSSFDLVEDDKDGRNYHINPLNGEKANNKFILRVLDTFAENANTPIIKKK